METDRQILVGNVNEGGQETGSGGRTSQVDAKIDPRWKVFRGPSSPRQPTVRRANIFLPSSYRGL